jgi:UDP-galactopyranose mutase
VTARVPTRTNRDDRYFTDQFQAMPRQGYTRMFENMLDSPNIKVMLNCDYREIEDEIKYGEMIYTGPVDSFFDYRYGELPYRSLEFKHETHDVEVYQQAPVVNYPQNQAYTRVTEHRSFMSFRVQKAIRIIRSRGLRTPRFTPSIKSWPMRRTMFILSVGSRPTSTTTWTRSSHRQ